MQYASLMPRPMPQQGQSVSYVGDNVGDNPGAAGYPPGHPMNRASSLSGMSAQMGNPSTQMPYGPTVPPPGGFGSMPPSSAQAPNMGGQQSPSAQVPTMPYGPFIPQGQYPQQPGSVTSSYGQQPGYGGLSSLYSMYRGY